MDPVAQEDPTAERELLVPRPLVETLGAGQDASPVTDLARNLGDLLTNSGTPRRRISWSSNEDTPDGLNNYQKSRLLREGNVANSPLNFCQEGSPMFQDRLLRDVSVADNCLNTSASRIIRRRVRTLPSVFQPQMQEAFGKENIPSCQKQQMSDESRNSSIHMPKSLFSQLPSSTLTSTSLAACENTGKVLFSSLCNMDSEETGCSFLQDKPASENIFTAPSHPPLRKSISPPKSFAKHQSTFRLNSTGSSFGCSSSERSSASASIIDSEEMEDGFLDVFEMDGMDVDIPSVNDFHLPRDFYRLLKDPLTANLAENQDFPKFSDHDENSEASGIPQTTLHSAESPRRPSIRRCLSMIEESPARASTSPRQKLLECVDRNNNFGNNFRRPEDTRKRLLQDEEDHTFKKPSDPPLCMKDQSSLENINKHIQGTKRRKSVSFLTKSPSDSLVLPNPRVLVERSHSETEAIITRALQKSSYNPNLIGDCSGSYALPLVKGRHDDLKAVSPETLSNLIKGTYADTVDVYEIVDCRYPYEFEGGHIKGACNLYTKDSIFENLIKQQSLTLGSKIRKILVFHCEFSSERGPNLCRFLRNKDREANKDNYPNLYHPEIYILEGGYREFYKNYKELCTPQGYLPMLSKDHETDLRKFRSKSKSWSGDSKSRLTPRPGLKL